jgi:methylthioribose-1-phosphate isomerase
MIETVRWHDGKVRWIDQRRLPATLEYVASDDLEELGQAIETLAIRGAPAIGVAAAFGMALAAHRAAAEGVDMPPALAAADARLRRTRPTAVNLFWALDRMAAVARSPEFPHLDAAGQARRLLAEAEAILQEDLETSRRIGIFGLALLKEGARVLTHCNAGGLATGGLGTALAPVYAAKAAGKRVELFADETRPLLQGARLTAWEMTREGVPVTLLCDGAAPGLLASGGVDIVIVGADRVAANGDTANKVGTLGAALAAKAAGIPFYVAAPLSTFDPNVATGAEIPIEQRRADEVTDTTTAGAPAGVAVYNPAFDVTPAALISGWITERGILKPPFPR